MQQLGKVLSPFTVDKWPSSLSYIFAKISVKTFHIIKLRLFSNWMNWRAPWNLQLNLINPPLYQYYKAALYIVSSPQEDGGLKLDLRENLHFQLLRLEEYWMRGHFLYLNKSEGDWGGIQYLVWIMLKHFAFCIFSHGLDVHI